MKVRSGRMNIPMRIERKTNSKGPGGGKRETWELFTMCMGDKQAFSQSSTDRNGQPQTRYVWEIRTPFIHGIVPEMRIQDMQTQEYYRIRANIDLENRGQVLRLRCDIFQ